MHCDKIKRLVLYFLVLVLLNFSVSVSIASESFKEPEFPVMELCRQKEFHKALKLLPKAMNAWEEYTKKTGSTSEGAAEYLYQFTMEEIAVKGDSSWGKIFDDPAIPYQFKTDLIFEILEKRLGKGSVFSVNQNHFIMPRLKKSVSRKKLIKKLFLHIKKSELGK